MRLLIIGTVLLLSGCAETTVPPHMDESVPVAGQPGLDEGPAHQPASMPSDQESAGGDETAPGANATPKPPSPKHWDGSVTVGIEAGDPWAYCRGPLNSCDQRGFQTKGTFDLNVTLSWNLPGSDLDVCLFRKASPEQVTCDGINQGLEAGTIEQRLKVERLPPGDYELWVAARHGAMVDYQLEATFSALGPP